MRLAMVSTLLIILGAIVGGAAGLALIFGMGPEQIPRWMITVGMYKLTFIAAGGLLVAGAMLGRAAGPRARDANIADDHATGGSAIGQGPFQPYADGQRDPQGVDRSGRDR